MLALVREVSAQLAHCELSFLERARIDPACAQQQHRAYTTALQQLGCQLEWLAPLPQHADGVFVEDTALVMAELAVITRPGVESRRGETASVAAALAGHRPVAHITAPGSLEGGDVLRIGKTYYVGASARSNPQGIEQLARLLAPYGYRVRSVALRGCLHLKSAVTLIPPDTVVLNPQWIDAAALDARTMIEVDEREPYAANTLSLSGTTLVSSAYPLTRRRLVAAGIRTLELEVTELHKAEAALTCLSVLVE
jgi:dimethylargininase